MLVEHKFGPVSRAAAVYAPSHVPGRDSRALQWHDNARGVDFSVTAGRFRGDEIIGIDLARQIAGAGLRTELNRIRSREGKAFIRSLVGIDYASANTLTLSAEFYRDGIGAGNTAAYDFAPMTLRRWPTACGRHWPNAISVCMQATRSRRCSN